MDDSFARLEDIEISHIKQYNNGLLVRGITDNFLHTDLTGTMIEIN